MERKEIRKGEIIVWPYSVCSGEDLLEYLSGLEARVLALEKQTWPSLQVEVLPGEAEILGKTYSLEELDTVNLFAVGVHGEDIVVLAPARNLTKEGALNLAAWLVAVSGEEEKFAALLERVMQT